MADFDNLFDDDYGYIEPEVTEQEEEQEVEEIQVEPQHEERDIIGELLRRQGISDPSKIKFEGDDEIIQERDWNDLSYEEQLNILTNDTNSNPETDLDDNEIDLINAVRTAKMSPIEYVNAIKEQAINEYLQGAPQEPHYTVDDYTDDELFVFDMQARMPDMTEEELQDALMNVKSNEAVYNKQVSGIRNEYKRLEQNKLQQEQQLQLQQQQDQYNQYANSVIDAIDNRSDIGGIFELEDDDKRLIAQAILGQDQAGISNLAKALNDPDNLVKMVWFALRGEEALDNLNEYYKDQISKARQAGYNKGLEGRTNPASSRVVKRPLQKNNAQIKDISDLY